MGKRYIFATLLTVLTVCSCSKNDDLEPRPELEHECVNLIIDTDLGNSTDDLLAIQGAFAYQSVGDCRILAVMTSRGKHDVQRFADATMHYYHADDIPLGTTPGEESFFEIVPYYKLVDMKDEQGNPMMQESGIPLSSRMESPELYRKILSEAPDHSVVIACIGFTTNIGKLLDSKPDKYSPLNGVDLIKQKVKSMSMMGCLFAKVKQRYSDELLNAEYNILGDIPLAQKLFREWPVALHVFPVEGGLVFPSDHDQVIHDYSWQPDNPIYKTYTHFDEWQTGDLGQYWWDIIPMVHAIQGERYFDCTDNGNITIKDDGQSDFVLDDKGKCHIISFNAVHYKTIYEALRIFSSYNPDNVTRL